MQISKTALGLIVAAGVTAGASAALVTSRLDTRPATTATETAGSDPSDASAAPVATQGVLPDTAPRLAPPGPAAAPAVARATAPLRIRPRPVPPAEPALATAGEAPVADDRPTLAAAETVTVAETFTAPEPVAVPEPALPEVPELVELVVAADSVIGLQIDSTITSERARVEDPVEAHVVRDVRVGDRVAIPAGAKVTGRVTLVERGGRLKERARLGVRFTSVALPGGERLAIQTETIYRDGDSQSGTSSAKIGGGAIGGAILGGILGGAKGAAIGSGVGAGAGTAAVIAGGRNQATLAAGSPVTIRVEQPVVITAER